MKEYNAALNDASFRQRFFAKLLRVPSGCLEWQGTTYRGYGHYHFSRDGDQLTHRIAWIIANGPIPDGLDVLHKCDNPPCCDPDHLFLGTLSENILDMYAKGRAASPEKRRLRKLTDEEKAEIRTLYKPRSHEFSQLALSKRFDVPESVVRDAVRDEFWPEI